MPEAAEVELFRRRLAPVIGEPIRAVSLVDPLIENVFDSATGTTVKGVRRLGKRLGLDLSDATTIAIHPGLTGEIRATVEGRAREHLRASFRFETVTFDFLDTRRLGRLSRMPTPSFATGYGSDLLDADLGTMTVAAELSATARRSVKSLMLDQSGPICGAGNYLIDETLFARRIHPADPATVHSPHDWLQIWLTCQQFALRALSGRPATLAQYLAPAEAVGEQRDTLVCYGRSGRPCVTCETALVRIRIARRGTTICPSCQTPATRTVERSSASPTQTQRTETTLG